MFHDDPDHFFLNLLSNKQEAKKKRNKQIEKLVSNNQNEDLDDSAFKKFQFIFKTEKVPRWRNPPAIPKKFYKKRKYQSEIGSFETQRKYVKKEYQKEPAQSEKESV